MLAELFFVIALFATPLIGPLWEHLCDTYSPYAMFVGGCFASQVFGYFLGCLPYMLMDARRERQHKVQPGVHPTSSQLWKACWDMIVSFVTVVLPLLIVGGCVIERVGISREGALPKWYTVAVHISYFFVVEDYLNYWLHRLLHLPWLYRRVHAVHHTYDAPFAVVAAYAHPAEVVILAIPTFAGPALLGPHLYTLMVWQVMRNYEAIDIHSGYELPFSLRRILPSYAGTAHHDYHHYMHSGNFASVFTWCDRLHGTHLGYENFVAKNKH